MVGDELSRKSPQIRGSTFPERENSKTHPFRGNFRNFPAKAAADPMVWVEARFPVRGVFDGQQKLTANVSRLECRLENNLDRSFSNVMFLVKNRFLFWCFGSNEVEFSSENIESLCWSVCK